MVGHCLSEIRGIQDGNLLFVVEICIFICSLQQENQTAGFLVAHREANFFGIGMPPLMLGMTDWVDFLPTCSSLLSLATRVAKNPRSLMNQLGLLPQGE